MCIYYDAHGVKHYIEEEFNIDPDQIEIEFPDTYKVAPTMPAPVVFKDSDGRKIELFEFGMMPNWGKAEDKQKNQYRFFNARDDKLLESGLWKPCFKSRRCIIPANGFYEPHKFHTEIEQPGGRKPSDSIPFYFHLKSRPVFGFAGIWDEWTNKETGEAIKSFSIITTSPNKIIKRIHNKKPRTPLILAREDYDFWLNDPNKPEDYFESGIFEPWPDDDMEAWQVTKSLDYGGNGPELIEPVENPVDISEQGNLF
ncbi:SOS response-associated peptidase [Halalkalibaculum sp. DA384]|uniref:SOS response-associated peptidase n=1 Tax=Halalkalibaculum sp. DA384 TaxID=3373606 RepID=UPI0037553C12